MIEDKTNEEIRMCCRILIVLEQHSTLMGKLRLTYMLI